MVVLALIFGALALLAGVVSHVFGHAARAIAELEPDSSVPFSAMIGWAAFFQAVLICFSLSGALFLTAHYAGWH